jgi:long-chain fatty acid transport protein
MSKCVVPGSVFIGLVLFFVTQQVAAQGIVLPGVGPINRSMGGAAVAAPLDAAGAIHWNPATLTGLDGNQVVIGAELLYPTTRLGSAAGPVSGQTLSDSGTFILPTVAVAWRPEESIWSFGLGLLAIGGFGSNFPAEPANPIVSPAFGGGALYSRLAALQFVPTAAIQLTDGLSFGFAPTISMAEASLDPNALDPMYPPAIAGRLRYGAGFQAGLYYRTDSCWDFGLSYKSPQWFEKFEYNTTGPGGVPAKTVLDIDYPAIYSLGIAYRGLPRWIWDVDFRYVDFASVRGFGDDTGFGTAVLPGQSPRPITGLGWQGVFAIATGVQYQCCEAISLRMGYIFNENPIAGEDTYFNVATSVIYQHIIALGATWRVTHSTSFSFAVLHAFENEIEGPIYDAVSGTPLPGTSVRAVQSIDAVVAGLEVRF